jgi:hypothetical protein
MPKTAEFRKINFKCPYLNLPKELLALASID